MKRAAVLLVWVTPLLYAQDSTTVEGTVTNSVTHAPVSGASVTLEIVRGPHYDATTDASGVFHIADVKPGEYRTSFHKSGYQDPPQTAPWEPGLRVGPGGNRLDVQLTPLATLSGRVLDPEGKPAARVEVGYNEFDTTETNADGEFVLTEIRPGFYKLFAKPKAVAAATAKNAKRTEVAITFYPATTDPAQAQSIQVRGGDRLSGFEIRLAVSPVYRVRGTVLDRTGKPAPRADVSLRSTSRVSLLAGYGIPRSTGTPGRVSFTSAQYFLSGGTRLLQEADVEADDHGAFEFPSVRPAEWVLRVESEPARDGLTTSGGATLSVTDKDVDGLRIPFSSPFALRGTVEWGDRPPPEASRQAALMLLTEEAGSGGRLGLVSGGSLVIDGITSGRYRMVPMPDGPAGYYVASLFLGTRDVLGQPFELTPDSPPIRVVYKPNAGTVRGTVEKGAGATVLLWPQPPGASDLIRSATCDSRGLFQFDSVAPGDYAVLALDRVQTSGDADAFLRTALANAARASVEEDSTATVQLSVTHWPD